jgi:hypothetical protein
VSVYLTIEKDDIRFKINLRNLAFVLIGSIIIADSLVILSNPHSREPMVIIVLDVTGAIALSLGILVICRLKLHGTHGKSFFCLTLGILLWFAADLTISYYYFILMIREVPPPASIADVFWLAGYVFFAVHLLITFKSIRNKINVIVIVAASVASSVFACITLAVHIPLILSEFSHHDYSVFVVDISYPIADAILIVPAVVILVTLRSDYEHSIPWSLFSMSLLVNAVADFGFINYVMNDNVESTWIWDLFFIADFLIMAAALYWYNRYYISRELANMKSTTQR